MDTLHSIRSQHPKTETSMRQLLKKGDERVAMKCVLIKLIESVAVEIYESGSTRV